MWLLSICRLGRSPSRADCGHRAQEQSMSLAVAQDSDYIVIGTDWQTRRAPPIGSGTDETHLPFTISLRNSGQVGVVFDDQNVGTAADDRR